LLTLMSKFPAESASENLSRFSRSRGHAPPTLE
jgi:hypothetical protein